MEEDPFAVDLSRVIWDLEGIDSILNQLIEFIIKNAAKGIAGGIAESIEKSYYYTEYQYDEFIESMNEDLVSTIAGGITGGIAENTIKVMDFARNAKSRKDILLQLSLVNNANNFENYIQPLVNKGWLTMTIPDKPTSPKQQYLTTLKGRMVLKFLKMKKI